MSHEKLHAAILGESGFPFGMAEIEKVKLLGKGLAEAGAKITVINRKGRFDPNRTMDLATEGIFEGVHYVYTSGTIYRPDAFIKRNLQKLKGIWGEISTIYRMSRKKDLDFAIVSTMDYFVLLRYRLLSLLLGFHLLLLHVEMSSAMVHRTGLWQTLNDRFFDRFAFALSDGVLPISRVLVEHVRKIAPNKPILQIPLLCDFSKFNLPKETEATPYLLYCGSASYLEIIEFITKAFDLMEEKVLCKLYLVIGGPKSEKNKVREMIGLMNKKEQVEFLTNLPYDELVRLFINASGLLIPLRPTLQDQARFPHKIGEYLASRNPIVTTNYGEVSHYFKDGETALIADAYDVLSFSKKMTFVINNPEISKTIGQKGHQLGLHEFEYGAHGRRIINFYNKISASPPRLEAEQS